MNIFERIEAMRGHAHDELLCILCEMAEMMGCEHAAVSETPIETPVAIAPTVIALPMDPVVDGEFVSVEAAMVLEAPATAAVSEPTVTVTEG